MWNEIGGTAILLAMIVGGVFFLYAAPTLVDAISDRIRYGTQPPADDMDEDEAEPEEAPATKTTVTPVAAPKTASPAIKSGGTKAAA
ncbi:hypothetical protein NQK81_01320 [Amycolatopsis roodepoortensis]|uniref:hypothetical protein n=1 Tax=Amycolatopsis roodepoortensis TaxID=700274 RepID=UPI00214B23B4|nr:hypothetical protein [Amycolatopsis roodepoortensis]UUV32115.1 hypothetical protein NQK81_01320 [Amycolatopsis roodepoortensis]